MPELHDKTQLKAFERAARIYCANAGLNPDLVARMPHPTIAGATMEIAQWEPIADRMVDLSQLLVAMRKAGEQMPASANDA